MVYGERWGPRLVVKLCPTLSSWILEVLGRDLRAAALSFVFEAAVDDA
jgi:hypothetical protein